MGRRFNVTGTCIPEKHYMADTKEKLDKIVRLIEQDSYFTINRARQYGKMFVRRFCMRVAGALKLSDYKDEPKSLWTTFSEDENMDTLKERIVTFCGQADREVLLLIDEVDKS